MSQKNKAEAAFSYGMSVVQKPGDILAILNGTKDIREGLPKADSFSQIEGEFREHGVDRGIENTQYTTYVDPRIENPLQESSFLFLLKTLPKDKYRVIALLLFLKNEMGFDYTYDDMAGIWGDSKVNIFNHITRIKRTMQDSGVAVKRHHFS